MNTYQRLRALAKARGITLSYVRPSKRWSQHNYYLLVYPGGSQKRLKNHAAVETYLVAYPMPVELATQVKGSQ